MNGLSVMPAVELLSMLRRGQISPLELAGEYIQQIERLNPQLNALVDFDAERVREQARALENSTGVRGPLFGLPMTIKASIATAGYRCELAACCIRATFRTKTQPRLIALSRPARSSWEPPIVLSF